MLPMKGETLLKMVGHDMGVWARVTGNVAAAATRNQFAVRPEASRLHEMGHAAFWNVILEDNAEWRQSS